MPDAKSYYEKGCAILGVQTCAEIDAYAREYEKAKWPGRSKYPKDWMTKREWYVWGGPEFAPPEDLPDTPPTRLPSPSPTDTKRAAPSPPSTSALSQPFRSQRSSPDAYIDYLFSEPASEIPLDFSDEIITKTQPASTTRRETKPSTNMINMEEESRSDSCEPIADSTLEQSDATLKQSDLTLQKPESTPEHSATEVNSSVTCPKTTLSQEKSSVGFSQDNTVEHLGADDALSSSRQSLEINHTPESDSKRRKRNIDEESDRERMRKRPRTLSPLASPNLCAGSNKRKREGDEGEDEERPNKRPRIRSPLASPSMFAGSNKREREDDEGQARPNQRLRSDSLDDASLAEPKVPQAKDFNTLSPTTDLARSFNRPIELAQSTHEQIKTWAQPIGCAAATPIPTAQFDLVSPTRANFNVPRTHYFSGTHVPNKSSKLILCRTRHSKEEIAAQYDKIRWTEPVVLDINFTKEGRRVTPRPSRKSSQSNYCNPLATLLPGFIALQLHCENLRLKIDVIETAKCYFHEAIVSGQCSELNPQAIAAACIGFAQEAIGVEPKWGRIFSGLKVTGSERGRAIMHLNHYLFC